MSDDPKPEATSSTPPAADAPAPSAASTSPPTAPSTSTAATGTALAPPPASPSRRPPPPSQTAIDWSSLGPSTAGEVLMDVLKIAVFSLVVMNGWAIAHHCGVTQNIAIGGFFGGLLATAAWKVYLAVADAFGTRVVGATYFVVGVAICASVLWFASAGESVTTSKQLKLFIHVIGLLFLYPAGIGLLAAVKGDEAVAGANPLGFPMTLRWFSTLWVLIAKEVRTFLSTGVPYIIMFIWTGLIGYLFCALIQWYQMQRMQDLPKPGEILSGTIFTLLALWIVWSAITMRLVAEERAMGTIETLLTVPVTDIQVILAKFLGAMAFYALNLAIFLGYHVILAVYAKDFDWGPVYTEFLGLFLWGGMSIAIGLFFSTLTKSQLVALILAFGAHTLLYLGTLFAERLVKEDSTVLRIPVKALAHYMSIDHHYKQFVSGVVSTESVAFFGSFTLLFLFASVRGLESQRWK